MNIKRSIKYILIKRGLYSSIKEKYLLFRLLLKCNLIKTIYYNFRLFPFSQALKLPIAVGKNVEIHNEGIIVLDCEIKPLMIICGIITIPAFESYDIKTKIYNKGTIIINNNINIHPGAKLWVKENAQFTLKGYNIIGSCSKVACHKDIYIGEYSGFAWECQIFDTDFHFTRDLVSGKIFNKDKPIYIGKNVFIGNHVNISKGTKLPDGAVVSSWSSVSGSFLKSCKLPPLIQGFKAMKVDEGYYIPHGYKMYIDERYGKIYKRMRENFKK